LETGLLGKIEVGAWRSGTSVVFEPPERQADDNARQLATLAISADKSGCSHFPDDPETAAKAGVK
jgi:hypothetical protein